MNKVSTYSCAILIFGLLNSLGSNAQSAYRKDSLVEKYYFYQNKAELSIVDSNYKEALVLYNLAFKYKSPNCRDVYNASKLALILNDTLTAKKYLENLAIHGLSKRVLENFIGKDFLSQHKLYYYFSKEYDSLLALYEKSEKPKLNTILDSIYRRDQAPRKVQYTNESLRIADDKNVDSLIFFINNYGFPSDDLVGLATPCGGIGFGGIYEFVHLHMRGRTVSYFDSIGLKAVMEGIYPPDEFALNYDFKFYPRKYATLIPEWTHNYNKTEHLPLEIINKNRAELYLESLEDYKKKLLFMQNQKPYWFSFLLAPQYAFVMNAANNKN